MTTEQILSHCYMLGRMARERRKGNNRPGGDSDFRAFYDASIADKDLSVRLDAMDNYQNGWMSADAELTAAT